MSNWIPANIALPTFDRPQQLPADNNDGVQQQQPVDEHMGLDPQRFSYPEPLAEQQNQLFINPQDLIPEEDIDLSALVYANSLLPDVPRPEPQFPTTEGFASSSYVLPQEQEHYPLPGRQNAEAMSSLRQSRIRKCDNCRRTRAHCSGHNPCNHCAAASVHCTYMLSAPKASPPKRQRSPDDEGEEAERPNKKKKTNKKNSKLPPPPPRSVPSQALVRRRPLLEVPLDGRCDRCRAGGEQDRPCDADHAAEIECSQCTKYRNLIDPNHICTARGGEYWQRRFANSRPTYPSWDLDTSCCVRCKEKRNENRPTLCDIDDRVKVGCTPCSVDGVLCKVYNEEKAMGISQEPDEPANFMWNRPTVADGVLKPGQKPWWRHMCRACHTQLGQRKWEACPWILDVRLGEYKCGRCVEKGVDCVDPWTGEQLDTPYRYNWIGDKILTTNKSAGRTGRQRCSNCLTNGMHCRGYKNEDLAFACTKCSIWGLTCQLPQRDGHIPTLPHMDRKMIGYSRVSTDKEMTFIGCKPCRDNGDNCDRKRPCDSCHNKQRKCDDWSGGMCKREGIVGGESPDYYMSLGYGPNGVDSTRWDVPEEDLVGPNKPKRAVASALSPLPILGEGETLSAPTEVQETAPRQFGAGVGEKYDEFWGNLSRRKPSDAPGKTADALSMSSSYIGLGGQAYFGDNNTAYEALGGGQKYEQWLGGFNAQQGGQSNGYENFPPFEGPPQNRDEVEQILGNDLDHFITDLQQPMGQGVEVPMDQPLAMDVDNGVDTDVREQSRIAGEIRQAMHLYARDMRFISVELRQFTIPEVFDVPEEVKPVQPPQRVLLQLEDDHPAHPRTPYQTSWDPPAYEKRLRELLSKWKRPAYNVLCDIPDEPLKFDSPVEGGETHCEESCPPCGATVRNGAHCENFQHQARPQPYTVCDECDMRGKRNLFEGPMPLTRGEFLNMRSYACEACVVTEEGTATFGGWWGGDAPTNPVTGCLCATKLLNRRLCQHHRYRLAATMMVQSMFVSEWVVTNFGPDKCLFCKERPSKLTVEGDFSTSLVYLCLNCQAVVCEQFERDLQLGVSDWLGGVEPVTLWKQNWERMVIE
ncbi:hypothetical protein LY78DRAFT_658654 [Colletotrichum sublineola]|uniref:Zn(2)-C6 fungal-type domain-containing protein n=1 Tax=Colletotrichum sublineola TaxID=1173701 RepID=A0A066XN59_COLSU|nr:hypothetical protein LY78DRAFT_658654 [Colletotrichum sublineola]KDN69099.1 hypothetical protein CSUB01_09060 [Colletotrichum sublineola]